MVSVVNQWSGVFSNTLNQATPPPGNSSCEVPVTPSGADGNWLWCMVAWRQPAGYVSTVAVGDDAHNHWTPFGSPATASPASGGMRVAIWYARAPHAIPETIFVSPTGYIPAMVAIVAETKGLSPWATVVGLAAAVGTDAAIPAPGAQALAWTLLGFDSTAGTAAPTAGLGWTQLTAVSVSNGGSDHSNDADLHVAWQVTSAAADGNWTPSGTPASNYAVLTAAVLVTGNTPVPASPTWPYIQAQAAFGAGALTPWDQLLWSDLTPRFQGLKVGRGEQYELDNIQSGTGTWKWSNNDGALTPDYQSSPYWLGVSGWQVSAGNGTLAPSLAYDYQGQTTAVFTPDGVTANGRFASVGGPVSTGIGNYYAQAAVLCPQGWSSVALSVSWFNNVGGFISSSAVQSGQAIAGQWLLLSGTATPPGGAVTGAIVVTPSGTPFPSTRFWVASAFLMAPTGQIVNSNPFFSIGPRTYTPVRLMATWPPPPAANAKTYVVHRGYMERWPQSLTNARYQIVGAVSVDAWTLTTALLQTMPRAEILADNPLAMWPLDDPAGSTSGSNKAPTPFGALQVVQSKNGPGASTQAFGADASFFAGDNNPSAWQVTGVTASNQGYSLYYQDTNLPVIGSAMSLEGWFSLPAGQPAGSADRAIMTISTAEGLAFEIYADHTTGQLSAIAFYEGGGTAPQVLSFGSILNGAWHHVAVTFDPAGNAIRSYVDGALQGTLSMVSTGQNLIGTGLPWWLSVIGRATPTSVAEMCNATAYDINLYPLTLPAPRIVTHYLSATTGMYGDDLAGERIERLLGLGSAAFPRCIPPGIDTVVGATDIGQSAVGQAVVNIAASDSEFLMIDAAGYIYSQSRIGGYNLPVFAVFGEQPAPPLNANWDFELGVSPWTAQNNAVLSQSAIWAYRGQHSALWHGDGVTAQPQITSEQVAVTPGVQYAVTAWFNSPQGWATGVALLLRWRTSGGTLISSSTSPTVPLTANVPDQLTASGRAPSTAAKVDILCQAAGTPGSSIQFLADWVPLTTAATEFPYLTNIGIDYDPTQVYNDATLTQLAGPSTPGAEAAGATIAVANRASMHRYGDRTLQQTSYLTDANVISDQGWWIVNTLGDPANRVSTMVLDPSANPDLWPVVLGIETGMVVYVNRRLAGTQPEITGYCLVMNVAHEIGARTWQTTLVLVPYTGNVLTTDDVMRGVLDGVNDTLGW